MVAGGGRHWHMLNLDGAHTLQAELRSLHRKPRGYVEEGAEAEDLLAVEAEVQPKPARQTSLAGFFGASRKPAASCSNATATAAAAADTDAAAAAAAEEEPPEAEGEEAEPAWVASGGKTLEVLDELAAQPVKDTGLASPQLAAPGTQCNADGLTWACVGCCRSPGVCVHKVRRIALHTRCTCACAGGARAGPRRCDALHCGRARVAPPPRCQGGGGSASGGGGGGGSARGGGCSLGGGGQLVR